MSQPLTRIDDQGEKTEVIGPYAWTTWQTADGWLSIELPQATGIYEVLCHNGSYDPSVQSRLPVAAVTVPTKLSGDWEDGHKDRVTKDCGHLQGIVYIGMTTNLKSRFGVLIKSWTSNPPKKLHGSRAKWNNASALQTQYSLSNMLFRCMQIGPTRDEALPPLNEAKEAKAVREWLKERWCDKGTDHNAPSASAGIAYEDNELKKYIQCFAALPALNTDKPEGGPEASAEWLSDYFAWLDEQGVYTDGDEAS